MEIFFLIWGETSPSTLLTVCSDTQTGCISTLHILFKNISTPIFEHGFAPLFFTHILKLPYE